MVVDAAARAVLPFAYRLKWHWELLTGQVTSGAAVAAWHDGRLLCVRHSYRPGWAFPGGEVGRDETPALTASRELYEETGVGVLPGLLAPVPFPWQGRNPFHLFECRLRRPPVLRIDNREIVAAAFLAPDEIADPEFRLQKYLEIVAQRPDLPTRRAA